MKIKGLDRFQVFNLESLFLQIRDGKAEACPVLADYGTAAIRRDFEGMHGIAERLHEAFLPLLIVDPDPSQWSRTGFTSPVAGLPETEYFMFKDRRETRDRLEDLAMFGSAETAEEIQEILDAGGHSTASLVIPVTGETAVYFMVEHRDRVLPGQTIRDATVERAQKFASKEDRAPNKKEWAILRDEVEAELLKNAPIRRSYVPVMLHDNLCYIFTASANAADSVLCFIRKALGTFPALPMVDEGHLSTFLATIAENGANGSPFGPFTAANYIKLEGEEKETHTIKGEDLLGNSILDELVSDGAYQTMELSYLIRDEQISDTPLLVKMNWQGIIKAWEITSQDDIGDFAERGSNIPNDGDAVNNRMADIWTTLAMLRIMMKAWQKAGIMGQGENPLEKWRVAIPDSEEV